MPMRWRFSVPRKSFRTQVRTEPIEFDVNDQTFRCRPGIAAGTLFKFVDIFGGGDDDDDGKVSAKTSLHAVMEFFREVMLPGEFERFQALIDDPDVAIAIADLAEIAGWLSGQYTARPTQPSSSEESSPTPPGPSSTDGPPAAVLTFSRPEPAPV